MIDTKQVRESDGLNPRSVVPTLPWQKYSSNAFAVSICPEMLTPTGYQILSRQGGRRSNIPLEQRPKAIYTFDQSYVVASLQRIYSRLECDSILFIELCCDACELPDDSPVRHSAGDDVAAIPSSETITLFNDEQIKAVKVLGGLQDKLAEYRALLPKPDEKGKYSPRYEKAVQLLETLENYLRLDCSVPSVKPTDKELSAKLRRL
jgi:hypothetical protein